MQRGRGAPHRTPARRQAADEGRRVFARREARTGDAFVVNIRPEREGDAAAVRTILVAAFGRQAEADLVEQLRRDEDFMLSLVADDGGICGYIGFPRLLVEGSRGVREA